MQTRVAQPRTGRTTAATTTTLRGVGWSKPSVSPFTVHSQSRRQAGDGNGQGDDIPGISMSRSDLLNAGKALGLALLPLGLGLQPAGAARALTQDENNVIRMFQRNKSSVVFITNLTLRRDAYTMNQMVVP